MWNSLRDEYWCFLRYFAHMRNAALTLVKKASNNTFDRHILHSNHTKAVLGAISFYKVIIFSRR